jgi:crotonobetainyl-CoA:carnitine CoA-transferase CaiB-like acyl-CoA transferase
VESGVGDSTGLTPKPGPLDGLRVVELARFQAGPRAGLLFSDMGADVIKIEKPAPGGLKEDRASSPTFKGQSIYFAVYNRGKKSVALDLRSSDGMAVLRELIGSADFVLENYRPGTMAKMGLGYEDLRKIKPDIILISVSGFGQYGPYRERPAFDSLGQAMSGLSMLTGQSDGKPIPTASSIIDRVSGLHATIGALAALRHRDRTGEGQVVDVALLDSALTLVEVPNSYYLATGEEGGETPRPVYRASDGWVVIAANHRTLQGMIDAVGGAKVASAGASEAGAPATATLAGDAGSAGVQATTQQRNPLGQELIDWCAARTVEEITKTLWEHEVPNAVVASTPQVVEDPHLWAREMLVKVPDAVAGELYVPGLSIKFSKTPGHIGLVPTLGQHTDEVLTAWLDYDADRIGALRASGAIG